MNKKQKDVAINSVTTLNQNLLKKLFNITRILSHVISSKAVAKNQLSPQHLMYNGFANYK